MLPCVSIFIHMDLGCMCVPNVEKHLWRVLSWSVISWFTQGRSHSRYRRDNFNWTCFMIMLLCSARLKVVVSGFHWTSTFGHTFAYTLVTVHMCVLLTTATSVLLSLLTSSRTCSLMQSKPEEVHKLVLMFVSYSCPLINYAVAKQWEYNSDRIHSNFFISCSPFYGCISC